MSFAPNSGRARSLSVQLNVRFVALFLGSLAFLAGFAYYFIAASIAAKDREIITAQLREYKARYEEGGLPELMNLFTNPDAPRKDRFVVRVADAANQALFMHVPDRELEFDPRSVRVHFDENERRILQVRAKDGSLWNLGSTPLPDGAILQVGLSNERSQEILGHLRDGLVAIIGGALLLALLGGAYFTRRALRPIQKLAETAQSVIATGDMTARVPTRKKGDELDELAQLFNQMLDKNQRLIQGMRESLDNVAHDLRTPLTRLRGIAELALRTANPPPMAEEALADCVEESDRVLTMLETLMDISEAEAGIMRLLREDLELHTIATEVADLYSDVAQEAGVALSCRVPAGLRVSADPNRLRQVLGNLVDNALKYTAAGGEVEVDASPDKSGVRLTVHDSGIGIPEDEQPKIWQRLYRGDKSRSQRGLGLGLSLVKAVVEAHGGEVDVKSEPGHGSTFTVVLPRAEPA
jgi:signal transduction histidine kinase